MRKVLTKSYHDGFRDILELSFPEKFTAATALNILYNIILENQMIFKMFKK